MRLKGIHLAMRSGMLAAETAFDAIGRGDVSAASLSRYKALVDEQRDQDGALSGSQRPPGVRARPLRRIALRRTRDGHRRPIDRRSARASPGTSGCELLDDYYGLRKRDILTGSNAVPPDRKTVFDKVTNVHFSGTQHDEDQPVHLLVHTEVCHTICGDEYGHPCVRFCPANVYEMVDAGDGTKRLQINASNCVHCKTCDIMDPYGVITWVPPEGGGGPQYDGM